MAIFCEVTYRPGKKKDAFWFGHINGKMTDKKKKKSDAFQCWYFNGKIQTAS